MSNNIYDAFGRLKICNPVTLFDAEHVGRRNESYDISGSYTYDGSNSAVFLESSGNVVSISQSKYIVPYQPGKSLLAMLTFAMSNSTTSTERVGYFSASHGIYFEKSNGVYSFVIRNHTDEEHRVVQSNWSGRHLISGTRVLDPSKTQIFWCDIEWLGVGTVRCGFIMDGITIVCHSFNHANIETTTYMSSAKLPIRYEIMETGSITKSLTQICGTVVSEGGYELRSLPKSIGKYDGITAITDEQSLISIRLGPQLINDIIVVLSNIDLLATGNASRAAYYKLVMNPDIPESTQWTDISNSAVQYTESADLSMNGTIIHSGFVSSRSVLDLNPDHKLNIQIGRTIGNVSDVITLRAANVVGSTVNLASTLTWYEI